MNSTPLTWPALACKDWQRRPLRTSITAAGVAIAIAALWSLLSFQQGYSDGMRGELDRLGAHILVVPKGCPYDAASIALHGASWPCYLKQEYLQQVRATPGVGTAAPVFMNAIYGQAGQQNIYVGVDNNILALKRGWVMQGHFPVHNNDLLIGGAVADRLKWHLGQEVALPGVAGQHGTVAGILNTAQGADDTFIYMPLADAQRIFHHPHELTHVLVRLKDPNDLDETVNQLRGCGAGLSMNVVPLAHLFQTIQGLVNSTRLLLGCIALIALLVAGAGVSNAILMTVVERTREIGIMRAVGASRGDIFRIFWLQTLQVCLVGGTCGIAFAFLAARVEESWLRARLPFAPTDTLIHWQWPIAALCLGCALLLGSMAGLLPAWRAASLSPATAMRTRGGGV